MKKIVIVLVVLALLLGAAGAFLVLRKDAYEQMQERFALLDKKMELRVTATKDGESLTGTYTVSYTSTQDSVEYSFQEYALFEWKDGAYVAPSERVRTEEGSFVWKDGAVTEQQGKQPPLDAQIITLSSISFREEYFAQVVTTDTSFEADVTDPTSFIGLPGTCLHTRISLSFDEECVRQMVLTYDTPGGESVTLSFTFSY